MERSIPEEHTRTAALLTDEGLNRLADAHVAVFGIGGVGGHLAEALARAGVGHLTLVDRDTVSLSNINRQAVALHSTVGKPKVAVMAERIRDINPSCEVEAFEMFYLPENADRFDLSAFDFVADCVDTVAAKIELAVRCEQAGTPLIAAMGAGNKLYPERFRISDISKTETDPLARVMRRELKKRGVKKLLCAWSDEPPRDYNILGENGKPAPASVSFVPSAMGLVMAGEIARTLAQI
jgi:tRNA A37 threonylcarbamoyladenosine dehydratase